TIRFYIEKVLEKVFVPQISGSWHRMMNEYNRHFPHYPQVDICCSDNINSDEVYGFSADMQPDLIVVSGTSLIREKLLSLKPTHGIVNLHTGLSPYVKGGPN